MLKKEKSFIEGNQYELTWIGLEVLPSPSMQIIHTFRYSICFLKSRNAPLQKKFNQVLYYTHRSVPDIKARAYHVFACTEQSL